MYIKQLILTFILFFLAVSPSVFAEPGTKIKTPVLPDRNKQVNSEIEFLKNPYVITQHRSNYVLPIAYDTNPTGSHDDHVEIKFQTSFRVPVWSNIIGDNGHLMFAYTNKSFWQAYNSKMSAPFRETNHEPEVFFVYFTDYKLMALRARAISFGFSHESNGRALRSRSWNRLYGSVQFELPEHYYVGLKTWYRIPESEKEDPADTEGDDNPNIEHYLGNFELSLFHQLEKHSFGLKLRNNLRADNKGSIQADYTYPIGRSFRGYLQLFNGYGESLIDYNRSKTRIGIGISLGAG